MELRLKIHNQEERYLPFWGLQVNQTLKDSVKIKIEVVLRRLPGIKAEPWALPQGKFSILVPSWLDSYNMRTLMLFGHELWVEWNKGIREKVLGSKVWFWRVLKRTSAVCACPSLHPFFLLVPLLATLLVSSAGKVQWGEGHAQRYVVLEGRQG